MVKERLECSPKSSLSISAARHGFATLLFRLGEGSLTLVKTAMLPITYIFMPALGGTGLQGDERLIRFIGHPDELSSLLKGGLSLTQAITFDDKLEAVWTDADDQWISTFFGKRADWERSRIVEKRKAMLATAYLSCWHRLSGVSDLQQLAKKYTPDDFCCAVTTSVERVLSSIIVRAGATMWLEFFPVRYLEDENRRLQEVLQGEFPRSGYPELEFKRADKYRGEKEARFVMHDHSATMGFPGAAALLAIDRPKWLYAAIDPKEFIESIYPLNKFSGNKVDTFLADYDYRCTVTCCTPTQLQALCLR